MIGWEYPPHNSGGLGVACQGMTEALASAGHHINFTLPYQFAGSVGHMSVHASPDPTVRKSQAQSPPWNAYSASSSIQQVSLRAAFVSGVDTLPQADLEHHVESYAQRVQKIAHSQSFDVIHAHDWLSFPAAMAVHADTGKPLVTHIHSTEYDRIPGGNGSSYIMQAEQRGMQAATHVIAVSEYTRQILIKQYGINPTKISVVHNGIAPHSTQVAQAQFAGRKPMVAFMGRITGQKGVHQFLEVAKRVTTILPEALFVIAGNGDLYHNVLLHNAAAGLSAHVLFAGFVRDRQKQQLLSRADVFIMPSLSEPFGLVALEAAQHNTPVIISKNSGVAEVLPSATQLDYWDTDKMSEAVLSLLKDREAAQLQIASQQRDLSHVTWQNSIEKLGSVYKRALLGTHG